MKKEDDNDFPLYDGKEGNINFDEQEDDFDFEPEDLPDCPLTDLVISNMMMSKPFGIHWDYDKMKEFLVKLGYKIITRYSDCREVEYEVAIKPNSSFIPEDDFSNIKEMFDSEVQDIMIGWLLKNK